MRTVLILGRDVALGQLTLRAMSLVYTTLLSIVPLLALSFSVLKAFGVRNQIQPLLLDLLEPLGEKGQEVALLFGASGRITVAEVLESVRAAGEDELLSPTE